MRTFTTGASRDTAHGKAIYSYRNPAVEQERAFYMMCHAKLPDGETRPMNNWWKGIPFDQGFESLQRHVTDLEAIVGGMKVYKERHEVDGEPHERTHYVRFSKKIPRGWKEVDLMEVLCAISFNVDVCILDLVQGRYKSSYPHLKD